MEIITLEAASKVPVPFDARIMHNSGPVEVIHILLRPGETVPLHDNPFDVLFYVLEGRGELTIEDEVQQVGGDSLIEIRTGTLRGWKNTGTEPVRLLVIKMAGTKF
ncbi:MAG: cupin domain-containing protein [Syntrophotalea acetylenica]|nr:cupin domain-containing protein [Syntrophotalea acetylenica]